MISDTKVVAIGGGTGLSTMLKGLKLHTHNITAVVTVADDGGSSGILRSDLGMLAPGDVRNCVSALAEVDPVMGELLNFRFKDGSLKGHSLGNLFLAALNETSSSFDEAVKKFSHLTGVVGTVYPVTNESVTLSALLEDGRLIEGESHIGVHHDGPKNGIVKLMVNPEKPKAVDGVIKALEKADIIVLPNVAVSLANYGLDAAYVTKVPAHEVGQCAVNELRRYGVDTQYMVRGGDRLGIYFCEKGEIGRASCRERV